MEFLVSLPLIQLIGEQNELHFSKESFAQKNVHLCCISFHVNEESCKSNTICVSALYSLKLKM